MTDPVQTALQSLPGVDRVLRDARCGPLLEAHSRVAVVSAVREALDEERAAIRSNGGSEAFDADRFWGNVSVRVERNARRNLRRVINATGIVLHTNLGRAPLAEEALGAIQEVARGYSNLEFDLETGKRGSRYRHVEDLICALTGAEAALVVNNCAAAVMLAVNTLAKDGEVVTSRGELIEIGGSFRIPEVVERSEADLVDVGTTNKTRAADFEAAITERTRMLLKVHPSNYKVVGFTEAPSREALVEIARSRNLIAMEDLGSGTLIDVRRFGLPYEPTVGDAVASGMDVVTFSGDKLLGGPQAGVVVGRAVPIGLMKKNPLARALRVDKMTLAALEATLRLYEDEDRLVEALPVHRMLNADAETVAARANKLVEALSGAASLTCEVVETQGYAGGGSVPDEALSGYGVAVVHEAMSEGALQAALRAGDPPVIARIDDGWVIVDLRTVFEDEISEVADALRRIAG